MPGEIKIVTPEQVELRFQLAGPGSRMLAMLCDQFIITGAYTLLILVALSFAVIQDNLPFESIAILIIIYYFLPLLYFFLFEAYMGGRTPGKMIFGLRVIRDTGHALDTRGCLIRNLMRTADQFPILYMLGGVVLFFNTQNRRIGDYVGGTLVVKDPRKISEAELNKSSAQAENSRTEQIGDEELLRQISAMASGVRREEYAAIRHLLDRAHQLDSAVVNESAQRLVNLVCERLEYSTERITDPLLFLRELSGEWERRKLH